MCFDHVTSTNSTSRSFSHICLDDIGQFIVSARLTRHIKPHTNDLYLTMKSVNEKLKIQ